LLNIDTADVILNQEIEMINKLNKIKEQKYNEIEKYKIETKIERRRTERIKELQPKIIKKIVKEQEVQG
jgi:transcription elongation factor GreA-like protein